MEKNYLATEAFTCLFYQMNPIAHAGLETEDSFPANPIRGCHFNQFLKSTKRRFHIEMNFGLMQRSYFIAQSKLISPTEVKTFIIN